MVIGCNKANPSNHKLQMYGQERNIDTLHSISERPTIQLGHCNHCHFGGKVCAAGHTMQPTLYQTEGCGSYDSLF